MAAMIFDKLQRKAWPWWAFVGCLAALCACLAILQNRWINEITRAEDERLHAQLQASLNQLSREFNSEIAAACIALLPRTSQIEAQGREQAYGARYAAWAQTHDRLFERIALVEHDDGSSVLLNLDLHTGRFAPGEWPAIRSFLRDRFDGPTGNSMLITLPGFGDGDLGHGPGDSRELLVLELNRDYLRSKLFPELLQRYVGGGGHLAYRAEVIASENPHDVIYESGAGYDAGVLAAPDASVALFELDRGDIMRQMGGGDHGPGPPGPGEMRGPRHRFEGGPPPDGGHRDAGGPHGFREPPPEFRGGPNFASTGPRWRLLVRHEAGSLEAVVASARWHNLITSASILALIVVLIAALVRLSRRAQRLAELQMNFVAGVSHELKTPLTVIRTAAFNLRGKLAGRPEQVEKYGALIQNESEKLTKLVEQVLGFAKTRAGRVIQTREPLAVASIIDAGLESSAVSVASCNVTIDKQIDPDLPLIYGDALALRHALQNLIDNAVKYATGDTCWIGVSASAVKDEKAIELRVKDRGPGIPAEEQRHIFDAFYRGRRAIDDQIHGTGLGLNMVKEIVEAHGGTVRVVSDPMRGTEFIIRLPAAAAELQHELAHSLG